MATNYIQRGHTLTLAAPYDVLSGACLKVGTLVGVAQYDALSGVDVETSLEGVHEVAKVSAQAWTVGQAIYWDNSAKLATSTASTNTALGHATEVAANPSSVGRVRLNHGPAGVAGPTNLQV